MMKMLEPNPNLPSPQLAIAIDFYSTAKVMLDAFLIPDGPELTAGLRKLLEAKDCLVRASLDSDPVDYRDR
jgi:hypothetical protein